jgi:GTP:adenosylcobinamide-phosphate guanylyltransferase
MVDSGTRRFPVILTAGDRGRARPVCGSNKAFLEVAGAPVFTHVLATLEQCPSVEKIYLVGPADALAAALRRPEIPFAGRKPIRIFEQWDNLYLNVWNASLEIFREYAGRNIDTDLAILVVPSDIPLAIPEEVEEFVQGADLEHFDYVVGITSQQVLKRFYPQKHRKGIRLMCFHVKEGSFRQNNLHLVKPVRIVNRVYIQKMYDYRLQREWGSIVRLFWEIFRTEEHTWRTLVQYGLLHAAAVFSRIPVPGLHRISASFLSKADLEASISNLLGTRFAGFETHYGGATVDIDTIEHYKIIQENFEEWKALQRQGPQASKVGGRAAAS